MAAAPRAGSGFDWMVVLAIALVTLTLEVRLARLWHLGYDETWHVFASTVEPLSQFVAELKNEAHPPLHYLLLRYTTAARDSLLWPRLPSIVPSLVTVVLVFLAARSLQIARPLTLVGSFAFAVAPAQLNMAVAARGYSLATMFTVWAYLHVLALLRRPTRRAGHSLAYAALAAAAMASEYSAALVVAIATATLVVGHWGAPLGRRRTAADPWWPLAASVLVASGLALVLYRRWAAFPATDHLLPFLPPADGSLVRFARDGLGHAAALLLYPVLGGPSKPGALAASLLGAALATSAVRLAFAPGRDPARAATLAVHLGLWCVVFALACGRLYPFGGHLRHQYVLFPFLLLSILIALDDIYRTMRSRTGAAAFCVVVTLGTALAASRGHGVSLDEFAGARFWWREVAIARDMLRAGDAVYTHQFNLIGLFSNLADWRWRSERRVGRVDRFLVERDDERLVALRHPTWTVPLPPTTELVGDLAAVMRESGNTGLVVLALPQPPFDLARERAPTARTELAALAARHGLHLTEYVVVDAGVIFRVEAADGASYAQNRDRG